MLAIDLNFVMVRISLDVFQNMLLFIQDDNKKPESGGILIGYFQEDTTYVITNCTTPQATDKQTRYGFVRSKKHAQNALNNMFAESQGKKIYLGEWHTHPEDTPTPSATDEISIQNRITKDRINSATIFMIIFGRTDFYISAVTINGTIFKRTINYSQILDSTIKTSSV